MTREGFAEYALRDEIKAAIRFAQQRAMYDTDPSAGNCYSFAWDSNGFGPQKNGIGAGFANYLGPGGVVALSGDYAGITLSPGSGIIYFDGLGNALKNNSCSGAASATTLTISSGSNTLTLNVWPTGYVQTP